MKIHESKTEIKVLSGTVVITLQFVTHVVLNF